MSLRERVPPYQHGEAPIRAAQEDSDVEEEALVNEYREAVQYDGMEDLGRVQSIASNQDIQAQLAAAATPLEFQATLETKFASYDSYCNLFHYILNSEGPVDLEVPNVRCVPRALKLGANGSSTSGPGTSSTSSSTNSTASAATAKRSLSRMTTRRKLRCYGRTRTRGAATACSTSSTP
jgi:hypothetical protein